jgi:hypothetical protein
VTLATGEAVLVFFAIIESGGVREIKFLGTKPLEKEPVLLLEEAHIVSIYGEAPKLSYFEAVSPFYTLDFLTSQLARAPSVK